MKTLALSATTAALLVVATLSYGQSSTNSEFPAAGAPANAPTLQQELKRTPGSSTNAEFPAAGAPENAPTVSEQLKKTPGSDANAEFPAADTPIRDKKD